MNLETSYGMANFRAMYIHRHKINVGAVFIGANKVLSKTIKMYICYILKKVKYRWESELRGQRSQAWLVFKKASLNPDKTTNN